MARRSKTDILEAVMEDLTIEGSDSEEYRTSLELSNLEVQLDIREQLTKLTDLLKLRLKGLI